MNPAANYKSMELRVGAETENIFNDTFFEKLDGVANALDNIEVNHLKNSSGLKHLPSNK